MDIGDRLGLWVLWVACQEGCGGGPRLLGPGAHCQCSGQCLPWLLMLAIAHMWPTVLKSFGTSSHALVGGPPTDALAYVAYLPCPPSACTYGSFWQQLCPGVWLAFGLEGSSSHPDFLSNALRTCCVMPLCFSMPGPGHPHADLLQP